MSGTRAWAAGLLACVAGVAQAGDYSMSADVEGTRGEYGTGTDSTVNTLTLGVQYQGERFGWSIAVPWLAVEAPADLVVSGGMVHSGPRRAIAGGGAAVAGSTRRTESGLGDVTIGANALLLEEIGATPFVGLAGEVKLATADEERGLGTGANDYSLEIGAAKGWLNGRAGYRWLGSIDDAELENVAYGALGVGHLFGSGAEAGVEYYAEQAVVEGGEGRSELTLYAAFPVGERLRLRGHLLKGFSDASPDVGVGIGVVSGL